MRRMILAKPDKIGAPVISVADGIEKADMGFGFSWLGRQQGG